MKVKLVFFESGDWETLLIDGRPVCSGHTIDTDWLLQTIWNRLGLPKEDLEVVYDYHPADEEGYGLL